MALSLCYTMPGVFGGGGGDMDGYQGSSLLVIGWLWESIKAVLENKQLNRCTYSVHCTVYTVYVM